MSTLGFSVGHGIVPFLSIARDLRRQAQNKRGRPLGCLRDGNGPSERLNPRLQKYKPRPALPVVVPFSIRVNFSKIRSLSDAGMAGPELEIVISTAPSDCVAMPIRPCSGVCLNELSRMFWMTR